MNPFVDRRRASLVVAARRDRFTGRHDFDPATFWASPELDRLRQPMRHVGKSQAMTVLFR
ncbi:hypothetical protein [Bradyrhizobium sp. JYMT SZCCT0428]|uniref:hypothetical protein n=1 Tax=Bradyrhizobium sp. JYMT SZCCT0428 TaxID=2807673 RepID=UPI001BA5C09D|nr:hypothetical protein [Bradyrhizobium sp. JYMT SZCCT0428]MBR1154609.1 hypothetical protein [Bradyrhizobium sp. JYMT SZCCT0428]